MRILSVGNRYPPWSLGGYEVVSSDAVRHLRQAGHAVRVLTTGPDPSDRLPQAPVAPDVHRDLRWYWHDHTFPAMNLRAVAALEQTNAAVLARHLGELSPDVVCWWAMGGMSLSLLEQVRRAGIPAVAAVGDEWLAYGPHVDRWMRRWRGRLAPMARAAEALWHVPARIDLDRAAKYLFASRYLLQAARAAGWRLPDAGVLPHGVDQARFGARPAGDWSWRLLYCGRIDPRKGIDTAVQALAHLPFEARLTIHGSGDEAHQTALEDLARRIGVRDRIHFGHSEHDEVADVYAHCDAVIFPVRWQEPWGLVPLEAMSVGRPLIAARAGGGPDEYLEEGRNCLRFPVGDAEALAGAVRQLAADPMLRGELTQAGRLTAHKFAARAFHQGLEEALRTAGS